MKVAVWKPGSRIDIERILSLDFTVKQCLFTDSKTILLSQTGQVFQVDPRKKISISVQVKFIDLAPQACLLISHYGQTFIMGRDTKNFGIFGIPGLQYSQDPILVPNLLDVPAITGSICGTHAAVIDQYGQVYMWGSGEFGELGTQFAMNQPPKRFQNLYKSRQVLCREGFTCICTQGGFLYIYGKLGSSTPEIQPVYPAQLEHHICTNIQGGSGFIAALTDEGCVCIFDECLQVIFLPMTSKSLITSIAACQSRVYGISRGNLYEWKEPDYFSQSDSCDKSRWVGMEYSLKGGVALHSSGISSVGLTFEGDWGLNPVKEIEPYRRSEFFNQLLQQVQGCMSPNRSISGLMSPSISITGYMSPERSITGRKSPTMSIVSPWVNSPDRFSDLTRLYSPSDQNTINTIIRCRIQHEQREAFMKAFRRALLLAREVFDNVREYSQKVLEFRERFEAFISPVEKLQYKFEVTHLALAFQKLVYFVPDIIIDPNSPKGLSAKAISKFFKEKQLQNTYTEFNIIKSTFITEKKLNSLFEILQNRSKNSKSSVFKTTKIKYSPSTRFSLQIGLQTIFDRLKIFLFQWPFARIKLFVKTTPFSSSHYRFNSKVRFHGNSLSSYKTNQYQSKPKPAPKPQCDLKMYEKELINRFKRHNVSYIKVPVSPQTPKDEIGEKKPPWRPPSANGRIRKPSVNTLERTKEYTENLQIRARAQLEPPKIPAGPKKLILRKSPFANNP